MDFAKAHYKCGKSQPSPMMVIFGQEFGYWLLVFWKILNKSDNMVTGNGPERIICSKYLRDFDIDRCLRSEHVGLRSAFMRKPQPLPLFSKVLLLLRIHISEPIKNIFPFCIICLKPWLDEMQMAQSIFMVSRIFCCEVTLNSSTDRIYKSWKSSAKWWQVQPLAFWIWNEHLVWPNHTMNVLPDRSSGHPDSMSIRSTWNVWRIIRAKFWRAHRERTMRLQDQTSGKINNYQRNWNAPNMM